MVAFTANGRKKKALKKFTATVAALRHVEDDLLSDAEKAALDGLIGEAKAAESSAERAADFLPRGETEFARIAPPRRFATVRDWLDVLAVALAVAFGIRGLFFQPFKIPTSSMQPTLYGIHYVEHGGAPWYQKCFNRINALFFSADRAELVVPQAGYPESFKPIGASGADIGFSGRKYHLPGEAGKIAEYTRLTNRRYEKGEVVCDGYVVTGDHLFVERFSTYLWGPKRGDVTVFTTEGIRNYDGKPLSKSGFYYIKRLAGLPGDRLKIVDGELFVQPKGEKEFRSIRTFHPIFEKLYSGRGGYQGHTNTIGGSFSNLLGRPGEVFPVPEDSYFMLGDNTRYSADSRAWGIVPRRNLVGTALFVFWPLSRRWGAADVPGPVDVPTGTPYGNTFPSMYKQ